MVVQPAKARYRMEDQGSGLCLKIPSRKHWFQILFTGIWSIAWVFLTFGVVGMAIIPLLLHTLNNTDHGTPITAVIFLLFWLTFWVFGGLFAVYTLLWQVIGYERIEVNVQSISLARKIFGFEKAKTYDASFIKDLRVAPDLLQSSLLLNMYSRGGFWRRNTGTLAFDYGAKTIRFGDMDEAEAKMALEDILRRYPEYRKE